MTTLEALVLQEPDPAHGHPIQLAAVSGVWRWVVELADTSAGAYVEWFDITDWYVGDRHQFGADQYMGDARARIVNVQLQIDESDLLAPWGLDTTSLFGEDVELDAGLLMRGGLARVAAGVTVEWLPAWTGRVDTWGDASYARGQTRVHEVTVVDTMADLANVPTVITSSNIDWDLWLAENLTEAGWQFGQDIYGDLGSAGLPQDLDMVAASTRMDAGTDPIGLVWRSLRSGRLVVHTAPRDTTNTDRYPNPLLDVYPGGLVFSYSPDVTDIEYIADDDQQPFGIQRTAAGVQNWFVVTSGTNIYAVDDPTSIDKYGVKPFQATWLIDNDPVVDDLLAARAFASVQALPLRTTIDHDGFFPALAMVDHLDPVTVIHTTAAGRPVVTVVGTVRNVIEERLFRAQDENGDSTLSWQSTVQVDVASTETAEALLPVEDLALVSAFTPGFGGPSGAEFSWTNPTQPDITPTDVEVRILERSLIWTSGTYAGVGADGTTVNWLSGGTAYTFQVRLVRRVDGVTTAVSPIRELLFVTPVVIGVTPIPDGEDTGGEVGTPPDFDPDDCIIEVEIQENDGTGWVTVGDPLTPGDGLTDEPDENGLYYFDPEIPNSFFNDGSMYRFRSREICGTVVGDWIVDPPFDPPDDWDDPCTVPSPISDPPFDDPDLIVYVPQICSPDIIREYVSGIEGAKGDALDEIQVSVADPGVHSLLSIADPAWSDTAGGIVAFGECPQITGHNEDKTIMCRVMVGDDDQSCVLFECAAMRLTATAVGGGGWRPGVTVYKIGSTVSLAGASVLTQGTTYTIAATHDYSTGDIKLYVDGIEDNTVGGTDNVATISVLPIWRVGAPPASWITDCAVWSVVISFVQPFLPSDIAGLHTWYDATTGIGANGSDQVTAWDVRDGFGSLIQPGSASNAVRINQATQNGLTTVTFASGMLTNSAQFMYAEIDGGGAITIFIVANPTTTSGTGLETFVSEDNVSDASSQLCFRAQTLSSPANEFIASGAKQGTGQWLTAGSGTGVVGSGARIMMFKIDTTGSPDTWSARVDETAGNSGTFTVNTTTTVNQFNVGAMNNNATPNHFFIGHMCEILIYTAAVSGSDILLIEAYLATKWGL